MQSLRWRKTRISVFPSIYLPVWDTAWLLLASRGSTAGCRVGHRLPRSYTDCCYWASCPWQRGGLGQRGNQRRFFCHSGCQTATGWCRMAPPGERAQCQFIRTSLIVLPIRLKYYAHVLGMLWCLWAAMMAPFILYYTKISKYDLDKRYFKG